MNGAVCCYDPEKRYNYSVLWGLGSIIVDIEGISAPKASESPIISCLWRVLIREM